MADAIAEILALRRAAAELEARLSDEDRAAMLLHPDAPPPLSDPVRDAVLIIDAHQNIVRFDANAERLFGYEADAVLGRNLGVLLPPELADIHAQHVAAFAASTDVARAMGRGARVLRGRRADGTTIPIEVSIIKTRDALGAGVKAALMREARAKQADGAAIRRAERALDVLAFVDDVTEGVADEAVIFQRVCDAVVSPGGYAAAWIGIPEHDERRTVRVVAHAGVDAAFFEELDICWCDGPRGRGPMGTSLRTGRPIVIQAVPTAPEYEAFRASVLRRGLMSGASFPLILEGRAVAALAVAAREEDAFDAHESTLLHQLASELARTIAALRARTAQQVAESRLAEVLDAANVMAWSRTSSGVTTLLGSAAERVLGYSADTLATDADVWARLVHPDDRQAVFTILDEAERVGRAAGRARFVQRDGDVRWLDFAARAATGRNGEVVGIEGYTIDVTDRVVANEVVEVRRANEALAAANRTKDEFLAAMSHELHTPLNAVLGLSESLGEDVYGLLNDKQRRAVTTIHASGRRLLGLVDDVLDLAAIEAGTLVLDRRLTDVHALCEASLEDVRYDATAKRIAVAMRIDGTFEPLFADPARLRQALVRLLRNAVKFTPEGGKAGLDVAFAAAHGAWRIAVWDEGVGIAEEDRARLFQRFTQLDGTLSRGHQGMGMGLALAGRLVGLHAGTIEVESQVGKGSRFTVVLPA